MINSPASNCAKRLIWRHGINPATPRPGSRIPIDDSLRRINRLLSI